MRKEPQQQQDEKENAREMKYALGMGLLSIKTIAYSERMKFVNKMRAIARSGERDTNEKGNNNSDDDDDNTPKQKKNE